MRRRKPKRANRVLKRGAPIKNSKPLEVRKALERRTRLRTTKGLERKTPLRAKAVPDRTSGLKRGPGPRRRSRKPSPGTREQRLAFKMVVVSRAPRGAQGRRICPVCRRVATVRNPLEAHHVTAQATIKRVVAGMGLDPVATLERLAALLWDAVNGLPVCRECHEDHTKAVRRIPRRFVTAAHREFARALGVEHLLDRYYPVE